MLAMEFAYFQMSVTMTEVAGGHLNRRKRQIQLTSFMQSRSKIEYDTKIYFGGLKC